MSSSTSVSPSQLSKALKCAVLKSDSTSISFEDALRTAKASGRVLAIFIRHFFCGNCQEYIRRISKEFPLSSSPQNLSIIIVGCGSPTLIQSYMVETGCAFPTYADPTTRLYDALGMHRSLSLGQKSPDYIQHTLLAGALKSFVQGVKRIGSGDALSGGDLNMNGGEFLFSVTDFDEKNISRSTLSLTWCHRMLNSRDHIEIKDLRSVIETTSLQRNPSESGSESGSKRKTKIPEMQLFTSSNPQPELRRPMSFRKHTTEIIQRANSITRTNSTKWKGYLNRSGSKPRSS